MKDKKIPIIVGVTGHRDLKQDNINELEQHVKTELTKLKKEYKYSDFIMLNSIA